MTDTPQLLLVHHLKTLKLPNAPNSLKGTSKNW